MAKGTIAKQIVTDKIKEVFGANFLGEFEKKLYVQAEENGEMVQVAIALTCPKNPITVNAAPAVRNGVLNFEDDAPILAAPAAIEIEQSEKDNIAEMMRRLGL